MNPFLWPSTNHNWTPAGTGTASSVLTLWQHYANLNNALFKKMQTLQILIDYVLHVSS